MSGAWHTPVALTLAAVRKLGPCEDSYRRVSAILPKRRKITARQAVEAGCNLDDLVWIASTVARTDRAVERRVRHWLADCAARVLHIYERDHPTDDRVRSAILAARQFADGQIDAAARAAAWAAARDAARDAAWDGARAAAWAAARDAAWDAALAAAWDGEEKWQLDRLAYWLTEDAPEPLTLPAKGIAA